MQKITQPGPFDPQATAYAARVFLGDGFTPAQVRALAADPATVARIGSCDVEATWGLLAWLAGAMDEIAEGAR